MGVRGGKGSGQGPEALPPRGASERWGIIRRSALPRAILPESRLKELLEILVLMSSKKGEVKNQVELLLDMCEQIVKTLAGIFGVKNDEVAILLLSRDGKHLKFAAPRKLASLGSIPVTKRDSIAIAVLQRTTGEVLNSVPSVRHVTFFETIKLRDKAIPIQKMISVPILHDGKAIGVAQISRKGDTPAQAGADFTSADLAKAQEIFGDIARFLVKARPDKY